MQVHNIQSFRQQRKNTSFGRQLTPIEKIENRVTIADAKKTLGIDHVDLIAHTPSLPSDPKEDTGIGVLSKNQGTKRFIDFAYENGIDGVVIEPSGIIGGPLYSPYDSTSFSKKTVVDVKALSEDKWGKLLSPEVAAEIVARKPKDAPKNRVTYEYSLGAQSEALKMAYENFKIKLEENNPQVKKLAKEFETYKKNNDFWLEKDSLYSVLAEINKDGYYMNWGNKLHQVLFDKTDTTYTAKEKQAEIAAVKAEHKDEINYYKFCQFVVDKQQNELADYATNVAKNHEKEELSVLSDALHRGDINITTYKNITEAMQRNKKGVNIIADRPIGFSAIDIWGQPDIFTTDEFMGSMPTDYSPLGQPWNFRFIKRDKMFNEDGSIGEGGKYLKELFLKTFRDNPGGVRIDHIHGLIDPWVYKQDGEGTKNGYRYMFRELLNGPLAELRKCGITEEKIIGIKDPIEAILNPDSNHRQQLAAKGGIDFNWAKWYVDSHRGEIEAAYSKTMTDIVLKAAEQAVKERAQVQGKELSPSELHKEVRGLIICEDAGFTTVPIRWAMYDLDLTGMRLAKYANPLDHTQKYRECNPNEQRNYWTVGTHDDTPFINQVEEYNQKGSRDDHANYIAGEMGMDSSPLKDRFQPWKFIKAKFGRMFLADWNPSTPNNILVHWPDLLGINVRYNTPGSENPAENWTARIPNERSFDEKYYNETLPSGQGVSVTESLKIAMEGMGNDFKNYNYSLFSALKSFTDKLNEKP